jgi:hypothetical protein
MAETDTVLVFVPVAVTPLGTAQEYAQALELSTLPIEILIVVVADA